MVGFFILLSFPIFKSESNSMKFDLGSKTAIVTGGGSGIGKAICVALAEQGGHVHILELKEELAQETVDEIIGNGGNAIAYTCNVAKQDEVIKAIAKIAQNGQIDILVNNAGIAHIGNVENTQEEDLDRIYDVNIKGVYNCIHAAIPFMKLKGGVIINMASVGGSVGLNDRFAYSMSKGAVLTMTYSVAKDYLDDAIRCNSISPGRVHTPFVDGFIAENYPGKEKEMFEKLSKTQPIGRMGTPEEIGNLALYLCSDEASFITGTDFPIDGGFIKLNA
jgi:NAD(P)-dependent dehydrogenase (short-subunit alcohol dehydrogenase family)